MGQFRTGVFFFQRPFILFSHVYDEGFRNVLEMPLQSGETYLKN